MSKASRQCFNPNCPGIILVAQSGKFINGVRALRYNCNTCKRQYASLQFFIPTDLLTYARKDGIKTMSYSYPITVELDPTVQPKLKIHHPPENDYRSRLGL